MRRLTTSRPSPALIVAVLALVLAVAGTAIAGPQAMISGLTKSTVKKIAKRQATRAVDGRFPVDGSEIADGTVGSAKLGGGAVTSSKLGDAAVTSTKLGDAAVTSTKLGAAAVTTDKLANGAVTAPKTAMQWALVDSDGTIVDQSGGISMTVVSGPNYYMDFGSNMAGKAIQATTVFRDADDGTGSSPLVALCGGPPLGATCSEPGTNNQNHVFVFTSDAAGNDDPQAFYVTVF